MAQLHCCQVRLWDPLPASKAHPSAPACPRIAQSSSPWSRSARQGSTGRRAELRARTRNMFVQATNTRSALLAGSAAAARQGSWARQSPLLKEPRARPGAQPQRAARVLSSPTCCCRVKSSGASNHETSSWFLRGAGQGQEVLGRKLMTGNNSAFSFTAASNTLEAERG